MIEIPLRNREAIEAEIATCQNRLAEGEAQLPALAATVDLDDAAGLAQIGRLKLEADILPLRITARQDALEKADATLLAACGDFISRVLSPKIRDHEERSRAKTRAALKSHFPPGGELERAVETSLLVRAAGANGVTLDLNPLGGPAAYAARILAAWRAVEVFESKL